MLPLSFPWLQRAGTPLLCGLTSYCRGFSCWEAQAERCAGFRSSSTWAQQLWLWDLVTAGHVGSFWTRDRSHVPCFGKWILNPWNPGKSLHLFFFFFTTFRSCLALGLDPVSPQAVLFRRALFTGSQWEGDCFLQECFGNRWELTGGPGAWSV